MDVAERADRWTQPDKARFGPRNPPGGRGMENAIAAAQGPNHAGTRPRPVALAKPQMEVYRSVPSFERIELRPVGTDAKRKRLVLEGTIDTLPSHSPLVTRWLKVFVLYDLEAKSIARITVTIRGELLE